MNLGEQLVGAWLKLCQGCDVVDTNLRSPESGLKGMGELDVVGFDFKRRQVYLCEVATHLDGLEYGKGYDDTVARVRKKHERQRHYAATYLSDFPTQTFMFWAPRVPKGRLSESLSKIEGLELVINGRYTERVNELRALARTTTKVTGNPVFRVLQILEHLR